MSLSREPPHVAASPERRFPLTFTMIAICLGLSGPLVLFGRLAGGIGFLLAGLIALTVLFRDEDFRRYCRECLSLKVLAVIGTLLVWWSISSIMSLDPSRSFSVIGRIVIIMAFGILIFFALRYDQVARHLAQMTFLFSYAVLTALVGVVLYVWVDLVYLFKPGLEGVPERANLFKYFGSVCALAIPVVLWVGFRKGPVRLPRMLAACIALFCSALIIWGLGQQTSGAGILGLIGAIAVAGVTVVLVQLPRWAKYVIVGLCLLAAAGVSTWVIGGLPDYPVTVEDRAGPLLPGIDFHRHAIWSFAVDQIAKAPLFGVGIDALPMAPGANEIVLDTNQEYIPGHPHNWVLEIAAETGLPGLALLLAMLAGAFWSLLQGYGKTRSPATLVGIAVLGAYATSSLANFSVWAAWWQGCGMIFLILALSEGMTSKSAQSRSNM